MMKFLRRPEMNSDAATRQVYRTWRERFVLPLLLGILVFGGIALFPAIRASDSLLVDAIFVTTYALVGLMAVIRFSYIVRISTFLLSVYMVGMAELITHGILGDGVFFFLGLIVFATMLISPRVGVAAIIASVITFVIMGWLMLSGHVIPLNPFATPSKVEDWISACASISMFGIVIIIGFQQLENEFTGAQKQVTSALDELEQERKNLETRVQERTLQLRSINEIERAVTAILDIQELLPRAVKIIQNEFDFYYTAIFLIDSTGQWAELREAAGDTGKILKENKHRVNINSRNLVAQTIRSKTGQIMKDAGQIRLENPLFPYTRSLLVVPLVVGNNVIGALEMHSSRENEFLPQDLDAYQNMANGISIAIENSRLFQESQQALTEMEATQRQYLEAAWNSLASDKPLNYELGDTDLADKNPLEIPLTLRNQIIGQIQMANTSDWTNEQKNLIESIAGQAALALENARLVEGSQYSAAQERLANEIISKIWGSTSMDGILQTTVRELGRGLEASEVEIEISMDGQDGE